MNDTLTSRPTSTTAARVTLRGAAVTRADRVGPKRCYGGVVQGDQPPGTPDHPGSERDRRRGLVVAESAQEQRLPAPYPLQRRAGQSSGDGRRDRNQVGMKKPGGAAAGRPAGNAVHPMRQLHENGALYSRGDACWQPRRYLAQNQRRRVVPGEHDGRRDGKGCREESGDDQCHAEYGQQPPEDARAGHSTRMVQNYPDRHTVLLISHLHPLNSDSNVAKADPATKDKATDGSEPYGS
jgi:hypothetical protein